MSNDFALINAKLDAIMALLSTRQSAPAPQVVAQGPTVASDADLDGPYGDPEIRFDPKRWEGASCKGLLYSDKRVSPEFLLMLAESFDYFARKEDEEGKVDKNGNPKSVWTRRDAGRARGWAARKQAAAPARAPGKCINGASKPAPLPAGFETATVEDADIPF